MRTYNVKAGDTWQSISITQLGLADPTKLIQTNPRFSGQIEPTPGNILNIPDLEELTENNPGGSTYVSIKGERIPFWEKVTIVKQMDTFSACTFEMPYTSQVSAYSPVAVVYNGQIMFRGILLGPQPRFNTEGSRVTWTAYSRAAVLSDCQPFPGTTRLFYNKNLKQISEEIINPFGIKVEYRTDPGKKFRSVERKIGGSAFSFLADKAKLRDTMITDNPETEAVVFYNPDEVERPSQKLSEGLAPVLEARVDFKPQEFFSEITGVLEAKSWHSGANYTWKNPYLADIVRPHVFSVNNTAPGEIEQAVKAKARRMFMDSFSVTIRVAGWFKANLDLWRPLDLIGFTAPSLGINKSVTLQIRKVIQRQNKSLQETELFCILKSSEGIPNNFPWSF